MSDARRYLLAFALYALDALGELVRALRWRR